MQIDTGIGQCFIDDAFLRVGLFTEFDFASIQTNHQIDMHGVHNHVLLVEVKLALQCFSFSVLLVPLNSVYLLLKQVFVLELL